MTRGYALLNGITGSIALSSSGWGKIAAKKCHLIDATGSNRGSVSTSSSNLSLVARIEMSGGLILRPVAGSTVSTQGCGEVAHRPRSTTRCGDIDSSLAGLGAWQRDLGNAPQSGESAGRQALHRADPGPRRLGCLRLGQLEVATQDDRGTLAGRQLGKGSTRTANVCVSRRQRVRVGTSVGSRYERGPGRAGDPAGTGGMSMQNPWPLAALRRVFSRPEATSAVWSHAAERSPR